MKLVINQDISFAYVNQKAQKIQELSQLFDLQLSNGYIKPSGVSYLSSLMYPKTTFLRDVEHSNDEKFRYLQRTNFFQNLGIELEEDFHRNSVSDNMLECTKVAKNNDPDFIDERLKKILKAHLGSKEHLILGILLTTYEVVDNILEHSKGGDFQLGDRLLEIPGFVCAQYYGGNKDMIQIGISDSGIGIVESMKDAYTDLTRKDILKKAFELNTTRHIKIMPSRGNGLAKLKEFVLESHGDLICRTNEFRIHFNLEYPNGIIHKENFDVIGTHFEINIGCGHDIDTRKIFNAEPGDYETDDFEDFFDF
ncbi:MAG: hypothetical protein WC667_08740 [Sulfurimonas sp.]|jgi:hypothetical protein